MKEARVGKDIVLSKEENEACWKWARRVAKEHRPSREVVNKQFFCKVCSKTYCVGFDSVDVYCKGCFYRSGCKKEVNGRRTCQKCGRR